MKVNMLFKNTVITINQKKYSTKKFIKKLLVFYTSNKHFLAKIMTNVSNEEITDAKKCPL